MANLDFGRLLKILALTQSSNDGEALNAIRMVNKILTDAKLSWAQILKVGAATANPSYSDEILRAATENARANRASEGAKWAGAEQYARDFNTDELRAKQAERDLRYKIYEDYEPAGWSEKGSRYFADDEPRVSAADIEGDAEEMSAHLEDEQQRANFYVFAVIEPKLAKFLFDQRSSGFLPRILYRTVVETGDISDAQKTVLRQRVGQAERKSARG